MELEFEKRTCRFLDRVLRENRTEEQTQEIRLGDGMPDVGRVIGAWGQVILRGKEWRGDCVVVSGGVMAWVLYAPEDGSEPRCLDTWLPFKMKWDLPEGLPEGEIRVNCMPRMVDGRSVSPRKILVRAVVSAGIEALCPGESQVYAPGEDIAGVELLRRSYPMGLYREAGEKTFLVDEELQPQGPGPKPEKILFCRLFPRITEGKVLTDRLVLRGHGDLRVLGRGEDGQLHSWDFELPFSQIAQLRGEFGPDARADLLMGVTSLEPELDGDGRLRVKCGLVAQYLVDDRELVELVEDAYAPGREISVHTGPLALPALLESREENIFGEQKLPMDGSRVVDWDFLPEQPRRRRTDSEVTMEFPGTFQVLSYGDNGELGMSNVHWEGELTLPADSETQVDGQIRYAPRPVCSQSDGGLNMTVQLPVKLLSTSRGEMPQVTGLTLGEESARDPQRPSLILRRAGTDDLWTIAKASGSTVEAIRRANELAQEPEADRMLLIPVS